MPHPEIVRRGANRFDDWREVVWRATGETIGWLRRDELSSMVIWDAYDENKEWLRGYGMQADAVRFLRSRWYRREEQNHE